MPQKITTWRGQCRVSACQGHSRATIGPPLAPSSSKSLCWSTARLPWAHPLFPQGTPHPSINGTQDLCMLSSICLSPSRGPKLWRMRHAKLGLPGDPGPSQEQASVETRLTLYYVSLHVCRPGACYGKSQRSILMYKIQRGPIMDPSGSRESNIA